MENHSNHSNNSEFEEVYFIINTTVYLSLFFIVVLPTLFLCLLCALALLVAEIIDWHMRVLLINIFVAEICFWLAITVYLIGYPMRAKGYGDEDISCRFTIGLLIVSDIQQLTSIILYAMNVYSFIKYNTQKLTWHFITVYLVISWTVTVFLGLLPQISAFGASDNNGFCETDANFPLYEVVLALLIAAAVSLLVVMIVVTLLTYFYTKRNALQESSDIKKAVRKYLIYLIIATALSFFGDLSFPLTSVHARGPLDQTVLHLVWIFIQLPLAITPIASIIILNPIRLALKHFFLKCTCRCKQTDSENSIPPAYSQSSV